LSGWYKLGAQLLHLTNGQPHKVWSSDNAISSHYAMPLVFGEHVYGFHGHAWEKGGPTLRCIEWSTGRLVWEQPQVGSGTLIRFGDHVLNLGDSGELQLAQLSPKEFKVKGRVQVVGRITRTYPAIADGFAYIKGPRQLACVDLRRK
jgi:hypothetical protein